MKACPACSDQLPAGAQFCIACGAAISPAAIGPTQRLAPALAGMPPLAPSPSPLTVTQRLAQLYPPLAHFPTGLFLVGWAGMLWIWTLGAQSLWMFVFPYWVCLALFLLLGSILLPPLRRLGHWTFLITIGLLALFDSPSIYLLLPYWVRVALIALAASAALKRLWKQSYPRLQRTVLVLGLAWLLVLPQIMRLVSPQIIRWNGEWALVQDAKRLHRGMTIDQVHTMMVGYPGGLAHGVDSNGQPFSKFIFDYYEGHGPVEELRIELKDDRVVGISIDLD